MGPALSPLGENFERHALYNCSANDDMHHTTFLAYQICNTSHSFRCEWQPSIPTYCISSLYLCLPNGRLPEIEHPSRTASDDILQIRPALPFGKSPKPYLLTVDASDDYSFGLEVTDRFVPRTLWREALRAQTMRTPMIIPNLLSRTKRTKGDHMP